MAWDKKPTHYTVTDDIEYEVDGDKIIIIDKHEEVDVIYLDQAIEEYMKLWIANNKGQTYQILSEDEIRGD